MEINFKNLAIIIEGIAKQFNEGKINDLELIGHLENLSLILKIVSLEE